MGPRQPHAATPPDRGPGPADPPSAESIALVLLEDNRLLREGIASRLRAESGFTVLAASADVDEALEQMCSAAPDVVLIDLGLPDHDSLGLAGTIRTDLPSARVIMMGLVASQDDVADYVRAGASGFVMKDATFDELFATIRAVARGGEVLPDALTNSLFSQIARNAIGQAPAHARDSVRLTAREREVVHLIGEGLSNKAIASRLHISVHTVKSHVHNILEKLALRSRLEVAAFSHGTRESRPDEP